MFVKLARVCGCGCVAALLATIGVLHADQRSQAAVASAPLPNQIAAARKIFISNAGQDNFEGGPIDVFSDNPPRVYDQVYQAIVSWGQYQLVGAPADADLVFEVSFLLTDNGLKRPELGRLRLNLRDPKTGIILWSLTRHVQIAILQSNREKNLGQATTALISDLKTFLSKAHAAGNSSTVP